MSFFIILILVGLIIYLVKKNKKTKNDIQNINIPNINNNDDDNTIDIPLPTENFPYKKKYLLTKNEWSFYKSLKPVADELGFCILAKIRVADLVEITAKDRSEWQKFFNKVNKKHVDFALAKPENLQIMLLIELDDNTHNEKQKDRDVFIDALYKQTGYKLLRVRGEGNLKNAVNDILDLNKVESSSPDSVDESVKS